jgi:excinuclease ABC subunit A
VVDRIKIRDDMTQRLADSIETALKLSDGLMTLAPYRDASFEEITFSAKHACPQCGHTIPELEPRYFSFNNPVGACHTCDGLGVQSIFDPEKIVIDPESSLSAGAIVTYGRNHPYHFQQICTLAAHYDFSIEKPFKSLSKKNRDYILYGTGDEVIDFKHQSANGKKFERSKPFEGVIPSMTRRYHESSDGPGREELAQYLTSSHCTACEGTRLQLGARHVFVGNKSISSISAMTTQEAHAFFEKLKFKGQRGEIAEKILREIRARLGFLIDVGLTYLAINRPAETLSGGEAQRIRLASQIGSGLVGVMYILDEPSIGLHQRDNERLIKTLTHLRDLGNTIIVVEHDEDTILAADHVIDVGPGAGIHGGEIVAEGTAKEIMANKASLTGQYLSGKKSIQAPSKRLENSCRQHIQIKEACCNNLQSVNASFPIGLFTCVTGVSGSGKSSLLNDTLYPIAQQVLNKAKLLNPPGKHQSIKGLEYLDKVVDIDQSPIGRTPRSNPATYTGLFTPIRDLFSATVDARTRGYNPGRFSFNVKGGRCESCEGDGVIRVEMHFLADVYVTCDVCQGKRYNRETLEIKYKGKSIHDVLEMTVEAALAFFEMIPKIARKLQTLHDVGLTYIKLGQSATTLSGGEAQRIKLARELAKRDTGKTLYILDEPTTGLHFHDVDQLLKVLFKLRDRGNTLIVIEHNLDVVKVADWVIDMGPEGGSGGGTIVVSGTPETVSKCPASHTGRFLKALLRKIPQV